MPTPSQFNAGFIIHFCRIFATTPHHPFLSHLWDNPSSSIFVPSLGQLFFFPFVPFDGILAAALYILTDVLQARAYRLYSVRRSRSVFCQRSGLTLKRSYSKIPAICSQKQKKGTFICKCHFFVYLCTIKRTSVWRCFLLTFNYYMYECMKKSLML